MAEDLESQGLLCHSYDALWSVQKRLRKINDLAIPTRRGLSTQQIGSFLVTFIFSIITYGLVAVPVMSLLGIPRDPRIMLAWLLVPSFLVAQQIAKPMAYSKSISGSLTSWLRYHLDDPVHRRGMPIASPAMPADERRIHYLRRWDMAEPYTAIEPSETPWTDDATEARFAGKPVDLGAWMDTQARTSAEAEAAERAKARIKTKDEVYYRRGEAATVLGPDDIERQDAA